MSAMLNILEDYCNFRSYSYVRFDGSTKCEDRHRYVSGFRGKRFSGLSFEMSNFLVFLLHTAVNSADVILFATVYSKAHGGIHRSSMCSKGSAGVPRV